jgi:ABC-type nitrate/sulfonate/bicarbonate transport system substrate-binding protein
VRRLKDDSIELVAVASAKYLEKHPQALPHLRQALKEASFYMAENKEKVNGWYHKLNGYDLKMVDAASRANHNYMATSLEKIEISISPALRKKLEALGKFLADQKLIKEAPDLARTLSP